MERERRPAAPAPSCDVEAARLLTDLEIAKARLEAGAASLSDPLAVEINALRRALTSLSLLRCAAIGLRA